MISACLTFPISEWFVKMSISRHLLLISVTLHLWPYKCFFLICLVCLFRWKCTSDYVIVVTILIFKIVLRSPSFLMTFHHHWDFSYNLASAVDYVMSFCFWVFLFFFFFKKNVLKCLCGISNTSVEVFVKPCQTNAWASVVSVGSAFVLCFGFPK